MESKAANYLSTKKKKDQLALAQYGDKLLCEQARSRRPRGAGG